MASLLGWLTGDDERRKAEANAQRAREQALRAPAKYGVLATPQGKRQLAQNTKMAPYKSAFSQAFDQANMLDNNRTVAQPKPQNQDSVLKQTTNILKTFREGAVQPYRYVGEGTARAIDYATGNRLDKATQQLNQSNADITRVYSQLRNAPYKPKNLDKAIRENAIRQSGTSKKINTERIATEKATNKRRFAANTAAVALDALTLGTGAKAGMGARQALQSASKRGLAEGAGAGFASTAGQEKVTAQDLAIGTLMGAGVGGALPYAGYGAKKILTPKAPLNQTGAIGKNVGKTPEELARANFKKTWDKAYGSRPNKVRTITELDKTNYTKRGKLPEGVTNEQMVVATQSTPPKVSIKDPLESLKQEARKYKSAEEFVNSYGEPVYHGSRSSDITEFNLDNLNATYMKDGLGINFTNDRSFAELYRRPKNQWGELASKDDGGGKVYKRYIKATNPLDLTASNRKVSDIVSLEQFKKIAKDGSEIKGEGRKYLERIGRSELTTATNDSRVVAKRVSEMTDDQLLEILYGTIKNKNAVGLDAGLESIFRESMFNYKLTESGKKELVESFRKHTGFDAFKTPKENGNYVITTIDPSNIKTKQQLTDLYNQATQSQPPKSTPTPKPKIPTVKQAVSGLDKADSGLVPDVPLKKKTDAEIMSLQNTPEGRTAPRNTKYSEVRPPKMRLKELDADAQDLVKRGASKDEVAKLYMDRTGMVYGDALKEADRLKTWAEPAGQVTVKQGEPYNITTKKAKKDPVVKQTLQGVSVARGASNVEGSLTAASIATKADQLGVKLDRPFIDRYQTGNLQTPAERELGQHIKGITDELFKREKALRPDIEYRENYVPQSYKQSEDIVENAMNKLQTDTGAANRRAFNTYSEAGNFGLTPKYSTLDQMIGESARKVNKATKNREVIKQGLESGLFTTKNKGVPVVGMEAPDGAQIYANKDVAGILNGVLQKDNTALEKGIGKVARSFETAQDVLLQGGVPGTNANFFVAGQLVKDTTRNIGKAPLHPIQAAKQETHLVSDFFRGKMRTQARFSQGTFKAGGQTIKNSDFVKDMADRGLYIQPQTGLSGAGKSAVRQGWNTLGNNPTFGRYMPNRQLSTAQEVYKQSVKKLGHDKALDLAAQTTKTFSGLVDTITKGRSNLSNDVRGVGLFANKYRESIINSLTNVVKSVYPTKWADKSYAPSRELFTGMALTLAGYEMLNRKLTGHSMTENRDYQQLSLEIPYGEKDEKGNQPVINIPFMPGYMTIPRAIYGAGTAVKNKDPKEFMAQAGKALSAPIQTGSSILANKDYFGRPIYNDEKTANEEGVKEDNPIQAAGKIGLYAVGQTSPAWVRAGMDKFLKDKPNEQVIAAALEAPVRFGKNMNDETEKYFDVTEKFEKGLDKNKRALFQTVQPDRKNIFGDEIREKKPGDRIAKFNTFKNNFDFFKEYSAYQKQLRDETGQTIDPIYELDDRKAKNVLVVRSLNPGESGDEKQKQLYGKDWYVGFKKKEENYYNALEKKFGKREDPYKYPLETGKIAKLQNEYYKLPEGDGPMGGNLSRRLYIESHPELTDYWDKRRVAQNRHRKALGLTPLEDPTKDFASNKKGSGSGSGSGGGRGGSRSKSASTDMTTTRQSKLSPPKITVKKLANPFPKKQVKKLSVSKIPTNYLNKKLG